MKIGIYDPYLDTLGGAELYILSAASCLSKHNDVRIFWEDSEILKKAEEKFHLDLKKVSVTPNIFRKDFSLLKRLMILRKFHAILFLSDGSIPLLTARKNFLVIQHPVDWVRNSYLNKLKLLRIKNIFVYSQFVKKYIDSTFGVDSFVLAPPVELFTYNEQKKENIILTVGRFTQGMNTKKQEEMIRVFQKMCDEGLEGWKLVLIGSSLSEDNDFVQQLKDKIHSYPIQIFHNANYKTVVDYYEKAKIYWHATGFGEDLDIHPERAEHFGISTVEAMGAGAVPVVINAGGQKEIVTDGVNGFLWNTLEELQDKTEILIQDKDFLHRLSGDAQNRAKDFSKEIFNHKITGIFTGFLK